MIIESNKFMSSNRIVKKSTDGTIKITQKTKDSCFVDSCILDLQYREIKKVICLSSQVGCKHKCFFCKNGHIAFYRNLSVNEIIEQFKVSLNYISNFEEIKCDVTYMGAGEPLNNVVEVKKSISILLMKYSNINKINISTILPHFKFGSLIDDSLKNRFHFQFSLHSPFESIRNKLFKSKLPNIKSSIDILSKYSIDINDSFCLNYVLFEGVNDREEDVAKLAELMKDKNCYLKVSSYVPLKNVELKPSNNQKRRRFMNNIKAVGIHVKSFKSKGVDIDAGCGQLVADIIEC